MLKAIQNFICGVVLGVSNVIPGVSGGTMAVVMGIYGPLLNALSFRNWKKHIGFLAAILAGMLAGILLFSKLIVLLYEHFPMQTDFFFFGLVAGSIPMIYKRMAQGGLRIGCILPFLLALGVMIALYLFEQQGATDTIQTQLTAGLLFKLFFAALLAAFAMVLPGVSGSMLMLILGMYSTVIHAVATPNFVLLAPIAVGVVVGTLVAVKLVKTLIARWPQFTYAAILGLILGSLISLYPGFPADALGITACIVLLAAGAIIAYLFSRSKAETEG